MEIRSIPIPEGWQGRALAARLVSAGMCSYMDLISGRVTVRDFFEMLRVVDWRDYITALGQQPVEG